MSPHEPRGDFDRSRAEAPVRHHPSPDRALERYPGAAKLELSLRQMRRLLGAFRRDGPAALPHRSRGRPSHRRIPPEIREKVLTLTSTRYPDFNDHHLTDILAEENGIHLSRCISFVTIRSVFPGRIQRLGSIDLRHLGET